MFTYRSQAHSLKAFISVIKHRIPPNIKMIAELRMEWKDIVGDAMSANSQPVKCEFVPKKGANGQPTGEYSRRLVVNVKDDTIKTAMTSYASMYIDQIPNKYKIHSIRFQHMSKEFVPTESLYKAKLPVINIPEDEKHRIYKKVQELTLPKDLEKTMIDYLMVCKNQEYKK